MAVWKKLASAKNTSGSNVEYIETGTFTANDFLRVEIIINKGANCGADQVTFNDDTSSGSYASRLSEHDSADEATNQTSANYLDFSKDGEDNEYMVMTIANKYNTEKLMEVEYISRDGGNGNSNSPKRAEWAAKWASNAQIVKIKVSGGGNTGFAAGSEITVYGSEGTATPAVHPNLPNGTIYEESDTGKHYMFDGTSAWNEM